MRLPKNPAQKAGMKQLLQHFPTLIFACAWCGPKTYPPLKIGEVYTHGICHHHKSRVISKITPNLQNKV